jgi:lipoic acid synthetase
LSQNLPVWFKQKIPRVGAITAVSSLLKDLRLNTVCHSAHCPNIGQCFARGTATFMILGDICTRRCTFCAVGKGQPSPPDTTEPQHIAEAVRRLKLNYVVITSVTRDDLPDGGAAHFANVIDKVPAEVTEVNVEVLIPDFHGNQSAIKAVVNAQPAVMSHNLETVPRLYLEVRPQANYQRSLNLLAYVKRLDPTMITKSGLMLGLGETKAEVESAMQDLRRVGCDLLTLGQYLAPGPQYYQVVDFVPPEEFAAYEPLALSMGFLGVASAPLVRSSFQASELYQRVKASNQDDA